MAKKILLLTDYKGFLGSKQYSKIYRGGFDLVLLQRIFEGYGFEVQKLSFDELQFKYTQVKKEKPIVLYQSSEDKDGYYKSFIEDIIYDLELSGVLTIPKFEYLKAHNNKVAMELLRKRSGIKEIQSIESKAFGTLEEVLHQKDNFNYPIVVKSAAGAMSRGVALASTPNHLKKVTKRLAATFSLKHDVKELLRKIKYRNRYVRESFYRNKVIVQNLIAGLENDWKVLVYGNKAFALYRGVRDGDFRASGSGRFLFMKKLPPGMLDFAFGIKEKFDVPHISLDIAYDGTNFHLIEFQFLYFGTTTLEKAPFYFEKQKGQWKVIEKSSLLEDVYVWSIVEYLKKQAR